jgi:hypothetical protein
MSQERPMHNAAPSGEARDPAGRRRSSRLSLVILGLLCVTAGVVGAVLLDALVPRPTGAVGPDPPAMADPDPPSLLGRPAVAFTLPAVDSEDEVGLERFRGRRPVVLIFGSFT